MTADRALVERLLALVRAGMTKAGHLAAKSTETRGHCVRRERHAVVDGRLQDLSRCTPMCEAARMTIEETERYLAEHGGERQAPLFAEGVA